MSRVYLSLVHISNSNTSFFPMIHDREMIIHHEKYSQKIVYTDIIIIIIFLKG